MPLLNYTHDFASLIGQPEDWNKLQTSLNEIRTALNALDDANFAAGSGMYTAYRTEHTATGVAHDLLGAGDHLFSSDGGFFLLEATNGVSLAFYLDDADYAITGRTLKLRVRAQCFTNGTAPARTFTVGLFPVSSVGGGVDQSSTTLGAVTAGSTVAFASPAANTPGQGNSGDFAFPADGNYALGVTISGAPTADSRTVIHAQLQQHWT